METTTNDASMHRHDWRAAAFRRATLAVLAMSFIVYGSANAAAQSCVSNLTGPPGLAYPLFDWRLIGKGSLPQSYGYVLTEDALQIDVQDGTAMGLAANQMQVTLVTSLSWQKEIVAWNRFRGAIQSISTPGPFEGVIQPPSGVFSLSMRITRTTCASTTHALVLRKAKFLGIMTDVYHLDPNNFWELWGGKSVTITWIADNAGNPTYPPPCVSPCVPLGSFVTRPQADRVTWRPNGGNWLFDGSGGSVTTQWGTTGDVPLRGHFDQDGLVDIAVWRPSTGMWHIITSQNGAMVSRQWGQNGDVPTPADFDGDGRSDFAVWRPATGMWHISGNTSGITSSWQWGQSGDVPVPADYDNDGRADLAIWRPSTGYWWIVNSSDNSRRSQQWGQPGDIPVPADYDNDGRADIAVWRPSNGMWYVIASSTGTWSMEQWGQAGDVPVPGDYDHDLRPDIAVWRPATGEWFYRLSATNRRIGFQWGMPGDIPLPPGRFR